MAIWYNVWQFGVVSGPSGPIFPVLVCLDPEKSGNPGADGKESWTRF
jgi:hypothetical protein